MKMVAKKPATHGTRTVYPMGLVRGKENVPARWGPQTIVVKLTGLTRFYGMCMYTYIYIHIYIYTVCIYIYMVNGDYKRT
jgi:hypothetical protein